jgi:hypothetical protein
MLLACAIAAVLTQTYNVGDYFPLTPGMKKTYESKSNKSIGKEVDTFGEPKLIDGVQAFPVTTTVNGVENGVAYYRLAGDTVFCVPVVTRPPNPDPFPILKVGAGKMKWEYLGNTSMMGSNYPMTLRAESTPKGKRKVLGENREVLEVKYTIVMGAGDGIVEIRQKMTTLFAKGLGIIEQSDESTINKVTTKRSIRLVEVQLPKPVSTTTTTTP